MSRDPEDPDTFDPDPDWADQADADEADARDDDATLTDVVEGEVVGNAFDRMMRRHVEALDVRVAQMMAEPPPPWSPAGITNDGATIYVGPVGTPEPLDLGHVARSWFSSPAPGRPVRTRIVDRVDGVAVDLDRGGRVIRGIAAGLTAAGAPVRVHNDHGSPALEVGGRDVAWFENWLRTKGMPS